jgi:hypothetical protein
VNVVQRNQGAGMSAIHEEGSREHTAENPTQDNEYNQDMQEYFNLPMKHESIKPVSDNHSLQRKSYTNRPMTSVVRHGSNPRPGMR